MKCVMFLNDYYVYEDDNDNINNNDAILKSTWRGDQIKVNNSYISYILFPILFLFHSYTPLNPSNHPFTLYHIVCY